jgi:hypothetical protein
LGVKTCGAFPNQPVIVLPGHSNVNIVIPWDKALVADRPQQGAGGQIVFQPQFCADPLKFK